MKINSVAVFCGSKTGTNILYKEHASALGHLLGNKKITLIYGGGRVGIMGVLADACLEQNGKVIGVIPQKLIDWEHQHIGITELIVVDDMHTRKKKMYELCDAAIVLSGGFGTLDELFEMLTWNQLSIHDKMIFILNSGGFYNHLINHIFQLQQEEMLYEKVDLRMKFLNSPEDFQAFI